MASCRICLDLCAIPNANIANSSYTLFETVAPKPDAFMEWNKFILHSLARSDPLLEWRESARDGRVYCTIMMNGLDQVQQGSWYRDGLN